MNFLISIFIFLTFLNRFLFGGVVYAQDCGADLDCQISQIQKSIDALTPAHKANKDELSGLEKQIANIRANIANLTKQVSALEKKILLQEEDLAYANLVFEQKTTDHYKFIRTYDPILTIITSNEASKAFQEIILRQKVADYDRTLMEKYSHDLSELKSNKETLVKSKNNLSSAGKSLDERASFLSTEVSKVEKYLNEMTQKQQDLIAQKAGGFSTSIGDTPPTYEPCSGPPGSSSFCDPGFKPAFAAFSFGAPHRTGLSQYGAYGRSKSGQSAETILSAYYQGATLKKDFPVPSTIGVTGYGRIAFEEKYLMGIYEVPESWGDNGGFEALKAQVVAARSYALAVTNNGAGTICTTEACQVYKNTPKTGKWADAVRATRGWVIVKDGQPTKTYFSASTGGFTINQWGWTGIKDTSGEWPGTAYEKVSGSPWFYKGWFSSRAGATCGQKNPWLSSDQLADILNAWHLITKGGGDASRVSPLDTSCWKGNPYSKSDLQNIGGYTSVSSVSVVYSNSGSTQSVTLGTNKGSISIDAQEFKKAFNLRAPGYIGIKSSLFNIEKL